MKENKVMSRTVSFIILGTVVTLVVGVMAVAAIFVISRDNVTVSEPGVVYTPVVIVPETPAATATATATVTGAAPTNTPTESATQPAATATATAVSVVNTPVQYVMALTDVNMRSGPGTSYNVISWVAEGQIARVTGASRDGGWWRVACPDGSSGSCWITAGRQYTQATEAPHNPPPTATASACTNAATFVADVTIPDGTQLVAGSDFTKTWRIQNNGTCTWDGRYYLVHAGGSTLSAVAEIIQLPATVAPGQTVDLTVQMRAPVTPGSYQSDWKLQSPQGAFFGVGRSGSPLWVKINVTAVPGTSTISGVIYQDANQNGVYDAGELLMGGREVWLIPGTACHVRQEPVAVMLSDSNGRYTFNGGYSGSYCVGLNGSGGLDDVVGVSIAAGQALQNVNLKSPVPGGSISGWLWDDYCLTNENGDALDGNCVADANGDYHADGMIQPAEGYIAGVTILLRAGSCLNNSAVAVAAVTDSYGRYVFGNLGPGPYCVSMNAASPENAPLLLPGDWTFPAQGVWYQEIMLRANDAVYPVNFGWDYQLR